MPEWDKTQTGKIVYRRKRHPFGVKDLNRIWDSISDTFNYEPWTYTDADREGVERLRQKVGYFLGEYIPKSEEKMNQVNEGFRNDLELLEGTKRLIAEISIDLLTEIIEKIPGIPQRLEREIAEWLYWTSVYGLDKLLGVR